MPHLDSLFNAFITILVTIDPPGLAPLFLALTGGMNRAERLQVSIRASVIGFGVLALFALAGAAILKAFGITLPAFRVAGGLLLFYIAAEMIFEQRNERKEKSASAAVTKDRIRDIAAFPLAIPLIAGPGAIVAVMLFMQGADTSGQYLAVAAGVLAVHLMLYLAMRYSTIIARVLGTSGITVLTRISGMLLAAIAVQLIGNAVFGFIADNT